MPGTAQRENPKLARILRSGTRTNKSWEIWDRNRLVSYDKSTNQLKVWAYFLWNVNHLVVGLEHFVIFHILGIIIPTDSYFSERLKPPTRNHIYEQIWETSMYCVFISLYSWIPTVIALLPIIAELEPHWSDVFHQLVVRVISSHLYNYNLL